MMLNREKTFLLLVFVMGVTLVTFLWRISAESPSLATPLPQEATAPEQRPITTAEPAAAERLPLMIRWSNWRPEFGPAIVYAREFDLDGMLRLQGPVSKMLMVTSYGEAERLMARADELKQAGVTAVGFNSENGLTPAAEMNTLLLPDASRNIIARVARLATANGFSVIWGPVRNVTDRVPPDVIRIIMEAGVTGLSLQEQKFIEVQSAESRRSAVQTTIDRYQAIADESGIAEFAFHVQIMQQRCPDLPNCVTFVSYLEQMPVASLAIWSNGPIPTQFIDAIRRQ